VYRYSEISKLSLTFPYGYDFASAFKEELVSCFKWIKNLHAKPKPPSEEIWADIVIKVRMIFSIDLIDSLSQTLTSLTFSWSFYSTD